MTKQFLFISLFFLHFDLSAQFNDLLKDNNIVWIGEFTTDFVVEGYNQLDTSDYINSVRLLKYLDTELNLYTNRDKPLLSKIENAFGKKLLPFYHQYTLLNSINPLPSVDTLEMIDPITYEKQVRIVYSCGIMFPPPVSYRAKQILFYDRKKKNFGLRVLAICLIVPARDMSGNITGIREFGWIKIHNQTTKIDLNAPNISLATRLSTKSNSPSFETDFKILKNTIGNIQQTFMTDWADKTSIDLYAPSNYKQKLSKEERKKVFMPFEPSPLLLKILNDSNALSALKKEIIRRKILKDEQDGFGDFMPLKKDSLNKPDTESALPKLIVSDSDSSNRNRPFQDKEDLPDLNYFGISSSRDSVIFNGTKEIHKLRIIQDWYWDEKLKTISVRLFAVAPLIKIYDNDGQFSYNLPIFFRLNDTR